MADQEEKTERSVVEKHGEEGEGLEEIIKQAKEGDLVIAKRALISFQRVEKEPKEESLLSDEKSMILIPLPPLKIPQAYPHKTQSN